MNGSRARKIRKQVYGELSTRTTQYSILRHIKKFMGRMLDGQQKEMKKVSGQLLCRGLRAKYKRAKKAWMMKKMGLIPWIFQGHWCKGTWENYINGLYESYRIAFLKP